MIEIKNLTTPSGRQFKTVIAGIRNAYKSYGRADSEIVKIGDREIFSLGKEDSKLAKTLIAADSPSHRKFLRQLPVVMDIKAPLFFWKQLDTFKIGTTANSESTMHCLTKNEFKLEDFSIENVKTVPSNEFKWGDIVPKEHLKTTIQLLNGLRDCYLDTKDKRFWYAINELLPQSYLQKRTWAANYEVLLNVIAQRINHKLPEWRSLIVYWLKNVPYLSEFAFHAGIIGVKEGDIVINDSTQEPLYSWI